MSIDNSKLEIASEVNLSDFISCLKDQFSQEEIIEFILQIDETVAMLDFTMDLHQKLAEVIDRENKDM